MENSTENKLKYEQLVNYLPFGLEIKTNNITRKMVCEMPFDFSNGAIVSINSVVLALGHRPILYKFSSFKRPITVSGEKLPFVPLTKLKSLFPDFYIDFDSEGLQIKYKNNSMYSRLDRICKMNEYLHKWHFDVYNLIFQGLAIDKETL